MPQETWPPPTSTFEGVAYCDQIDQWLVYVKPDQHPRLYCGAYSPKQVAEGWYARYKFAWTEDDTVSDAEREIRERYRQFSLSGNPDWVLGPRRTKSCDEMVVLDGGTRYFLPDLTITRREPE